MLDKIFKELGITPEAYFLTGSVALNNEELNFTVSNNNSDIDYVLLIDYRDKLISWLYRNKITIEFSCYNGGFKFNLDGKIYNIITVVYIEFMAWREALNILKYLITVDYRYKKIISDKLSRYCAYEQLRGFIKTFLTLGELLK